MRCSVPLLVLVFWATAHAQGGKDLMDTPECRAARERFEQVLAAGGPRDRLTAVRRQTAMSCFGQEPAPPPDNRFVPPPVAVDPIRLRAEPMLPPPAPLLPVPEAPVAIPRAPVVTICDAAGCWDSNGARYNQHGAALLGPRGACVQQGGAMNCP